jgi:hypothetical protein
MSTTGDLDDLIEAGWHVLDSDFDPAAFHHWREQASICLEALLGRNHPYTQSLKSFEAEAKTLLASGSILTPTKGEPE